MGFHDISEQFKHHAWPQRDTNIGYVIFFIQSGKALCKITKVR